MGMEVTCSAKFCRLLPESLVSVYSDKRLAEGSNIKTVWNGNFCECVANFPMLDPVWLHHAVTRKWLRHTLQEVECARVGIFRHSHLLPHVSKHFIYGSHHKLVGALTVELDARTGDNRKTISNLKGDIALRSEHVGMDLSQAECRIRNIIRKTSPAVFDFPGND